MFLKTGITRGQLKFLKCQKDTKLVTYRLGDMKDKDIISGFCEYELQKVKKWNIVT